MKSATLYGLQLDKLMADLNAAIAAATAALGGFAATLSIIHEAVSDQPKLCDALCMIEVLADDHAGRPDAAALRSD